MMAIVPCAGKGKRLNELGKNIPKSLLKIDGESLIDRTLNHIERLGLKPIVIVVGDQKKMIMAHVKRRGNEDIVFCHQKYLNGLPCAIFHAWNQYKKENVFIYLPDNYLTSYFDSERLLDNFKRYQPDILMGVERKKARFSRPSIQGVSLSKGKELIKVNGFKKSTTNDCFTVTGLFIHSQRTMEMFQQLPLKDNHQEYEVQKIWENALQKGYPIMAQQLFGERLDITTDDDWKRANTYVKDMRKKQLIGVVVILINGNNQILLMQRDDIPTIGYPNYWSLFGGTAEKGETAEMAARRELYEEIGIDATRLIYITHYEEKLKKEFIFSYHIHLNTLKLKLNEGKRFKSFHKDKIPFGSIRNDDRWALKYYLSQKDSMDSNAN